MFIGRTQEIQALTAAFDAKKANISIVYGRRRIGKSFLIAEAAKGYKFYSFEGLENQPSSFQKQAFIEQLEHYGVKSGVTKNQSWYKILSTLSMLLAEQSNVVLLLDELQWLANYRGDLVSNFKLVWEQILSKHHNCKLVLCGSVASFMVRKVIRSKALYGRSDLTIHLQPFQLAEAKQMLAGSSLDETILAYLLTGGVPKYLSLLTDKSSVMLSMAFHCQGNNAYFTNEFEKIFVSHFGKNSGYEKVVRLLKERIYGLTRLDIAKKLKVANSGQLTETLENLESAGIIKAFVPFNQKTNSIKRRYLLVDNFIRFYLAFLEPLILSAEVNRIDFLNQVFNTPQMNSWLGKSFEFLCINHLEEISRALGFAAVRYQAGPYYLADKDSTTQIDLVFKRADHVYTVCEVKYQKNLVISDAAKQVTESINKVKELVNKTVQKVLIIGTDGAKELDNGKYFSRVLGVDELLT